jgi:putative two-component system response regulator
MSTDTETETARPTILAVDDLFDAFISQRIYNPPIPIEQARDIIAGEHERHIDPEVVDVFLAGFSDIMSTTQRHRGSACFQAAVYFHRKGRQ